MMVRVGTVALVLWTALGLSACGGTPATGAPARLPAGFVGVTAAEVFGADAGSRRQALDAQRAAGIRTLRQWINWEEIERTPGKLDFEAYDLFVADAARAGLRVVPVLFGMPKWHAAKARRGAKVREVTRFPPRHLKTYLRYVRAVVKRYGRNGWLWRNDPSLPPMPMKSFQIWNEPNLPQYWGGKPNAREYVRMLRGASRTIRAVDRRAEILAGGLPESKQGIPLLRFVQQMYNAGAKGSFNTLAVHPYSRTAAGVLKRAKAAHQVSVRNGDGKVGLWITEVGWAASAQAPPSYFTVSEETQADLIDELYYDGAELASKIKLRGIIYYSWRDVPPFPGGRDFWGLHTGLVNRDNSVKPALTALAAIADELADQQ